ncbi:MAG: FUSC family protein [Acidobacteriaceae bacterium]|nr:FUSC family protein [Acidobacteriaceae bacterium]
MDQPPRPAAAFQRTIRRLDKSKINSTWIAFRNALAVAAPLGIGMALGNALGAVAITTGALNVSYSDGPDPYGRRARRMLAWSILGALAVFVGSVTGRFHWAAILVAAMWAFAGGMCVAISSRAGDLGLNTLVALVVFAARGAMPLKGALIAAGLVLGGGLLQTTFALLFWPLRRYEPERRAVGNTYLALREELKPQADLLLPGPLAAPSAEVQDTLAALGRDHSLEGERFRLLFDQADRIRRSVFLLDRLRSEVAVAQDNGQNASEPAAEYIDQLLDIACKLVDAIGHCLISANCTAGQASALQELNALVKKAHDLRPESLGAEILAAVDGLAGQLRAAAELASHAIPQGLETFAEREAAQPWRLQLAGWFATLRANLHFNSPAFRHAVRLAACVAIGDAIGRSMTGQRSYWLPMTIAVVLKPDFTTTFSRGVLRLLGTLAGLALATALFHLLPSSAVTQLFLVGIFTFVLRWLGPANYGIFSVAISGLIVFLMAATGVPPAQVVVERAVNTAAGGVFALIAYAVWPTWERTQVSEAMADMLEACRSYFHAVVERFGREDPELETELNETRRAWRRARSDAEASVDRVSSEPGISQERLDCLTSMLASSHALMHAMMGLEAGVVETPVRTTSEAYRTFAHDVEFTLYFLAAALRGSAAANETLPELRADHRRLVEARVAFSPADEFVLIETDRLTTALNTLREQVMRYVAA